jgi:carbamate kinase
MRVLIALDDADIPGALEFLAEIAAEHEVVVACSEGAAFRLALGNALPDRDVVTVLSQIVVSAEDPAIAAAPGERSADPIAISELRSVRGLIAAGSLVVCACREDAPAVVGEAGAMQGVEASVDGNLVAALLARRLDADLLLFISGGGSGAPVAQEEAARRFTESSGRRAAVGSVTELQRFVTGAGPHDRVTLPRDDGFRSG